MARWLAHVLAAGVVSLAPQAMADEVAACNEALVRGQELSRDGRLLEARATYPKCLRSECDPALRAVCSSFLEDVTARVPSLVVSLQPEMPGALCTIDGRRIDAARPADVDPGVHVVRCVSGDGIPAETRVTVGAREQMRRVVVSLAKPLSAAPPRPMETRRLGVPAATYVLGGVAVIALGSFATFGLMGRETERELRAQCPLGPCDSSAMRREYLVADLSAIAALLSAGGALYAAITAQP